MLTENVEEKGCFSGCLPFLIIGAILGAFFVTKYFDGLSLQYHLQGPMGKVTGIMLGSIVGLIAGGIIGIIVGRIMTFVKKKNEDF